jgi:hypothetical protein
MDMLLAEQQPMVPFHRKATGEDTGHNPSNRKSQGLHQVMTIEPSGTVAKLKKLRTHDEHFDAKFKVLGDLVNAHIEEEEGEIFPQAEESSIDWEDLSAQVL